MKYTFEGNFGTMELIVDNEGNAMGKYQKGGMLTGTFEEDTFKGTWQNKGMSGLVHFTVSEGKLNGNWKKGTEPGPMKSKWKGEEIQPESTVNQVEPVVTEEKDDLYEKAMDLVISEQFAAISLLQQKLLLGRNRSSRIIDQLKDSGIIEQTPIEGTDVYSISDKHKIKWKDDCIEAEMKDLINEAREQIIGIEDENYCSTSFLQRKLKIGYNLASKLTEQLELAGILGPDEAGKHAILVGASSLNDNSTQADESGGIEPEETLGAPKELKESPLKSEIKDLYDEDKYLEAITLFEDNKAVLEVDEDSVYYYLWSLWLSDDNEDKCDDQVIDYSIKFSTDRWAKLRGHYASHKKWYDHALDHYKTCSEKHYKAIKKIFEDFSDLINAEEWDQAIKYFQENLVGSISKETLEFGLNYCRALYRSSGGTEKKGLEQLKEYLETHPDHKPFLDLAGAIAEWLGKNEQDFERLDEAASFYKKSGNKDQLAKVKEAVKEVKAAIKKKAADEKQAAKDAVAAEKKAAAEKKLKEHRFKTARGFTFCQFCGYDRSFSSYPCSEKVHGHNFTMQKVDGDWKPICTKCGYDNGYARYSCS